MILLSYHAVGCALIVGCSKKTISHVQTYAVPCLMPTEREYERLWNVKKEHQRVYSWRHLIKEDPDDSSRWWSLSKTFLRFTYPDKDKMVFPKSKFWNNISAYLFPTFWIWMHSPSFHILHSFLRHSLLKKLKIKILLLWFSNHFTRIGSFAVFVSTSRNMSVTFGHMRTLRAIR